MKIQLGAKEIADVASQNRTSSSNVPLFPKENVLAAASASFGFFLDEGRSEEAQKAAKPLAFAPEYNGAVLITHGPYTVKPTYEVIDESGRKIGIELFVYHQTAAQKQNEALAKELMAEKEALFVGCEEEYLYSVLAEASEDLFYETITERAQGLPIYEVRYDEEGAFQITDLGTVQPLEHATYH